MNDRIRRTLDQMGPGGRANLLHRFDVYTTDGDNCRAGLTLQEVELLIAIADDPDSVFD